MTADNGGRVFDGAPPIDISPLQPGHKQARASTAAAAAWLGNKFSPFDQGARTLTSLRALATAAKRWSKLTKASQPSAFDRCSASAKSIPPRIHSNALAATAGSSNVTRGSPAKALRAAMI